MSAPETRSDDELDALLRRKGGDVTLGDLSRVLFGGEHGFDIRPYLPVRETQSAERHFDD